MAPEFPAGPATAAQFVFSSHSNASSPRFAEANPPTSRWRQRNRIANAISAPTRCAERAESVAVAQERPHHPIRSIPPDGFRRNASCRRKRAISCIGDHAKRRKGQPLDRAARAAT